MACRNSSTITLHHSAHSAVASLAKGKDLLICIWLARAKVDTRKAIKTLTSQFRRNSPEGIRRQMAFKCQRADCEKCFLVS